eukprot:101796-Pleurochrysis_carterae.AAC.2
MKVKQSKLIGVRYLRASTSRARAARSARALLHPARAHQQRRSASRRGERALRRGGKRPCSVGARRAPQSTESNESQGK